MTESTNTMRTISINLSTLEESNYFGSDIAEIESVKPAWISAMENLAKRDGFQINLVSSGMIGAVSTLAVDGLDDNEDVYDTPEWAWFDKASDEAMGTACASA